MNEPIRPVELYLRVVGDRARVSFTYVSAVDGATRTTVLDKGAPVSSRGARNLVLQTVRAAEQVERMRRAELAAAAADGSAAP